MSNLDWAIIVIYLVAVVGLGVTAGFLRRKNERGGARRFQLLQGVCPGDAGAKIRQHH